MNKYLPALLFAICIVIALVLAVSMPPFWPAALAIALAGAALAMAFRAQSGTEIGYLIDDIAVLQNENTELRTEITRTHSMIDELADVVEQIASVSMETNDGASLEDLETVRAELVEMRSQADARAADDTILTRLASVEDGLVNLTAPNDATLMLTDTVRAPSLAAAPSVPAPAASPVDTGALHSLIARAGESKDRAAQKPNQPKPQPEPQQPKPAPVPSASLTPVFKPTLGAPVAFMLAVSGPDTPAVVPGLLREAAKIATELEEAGREILLFVRLSPRTLADLTVRHDILTAIEETPALQLRLTLLTPQEGFDLTVQHTLAAIAEHGCRFALEGVRDWSLDLATLANAGLGYIVVDGIAMAQSAKDQGGDPRRLAQALGAHGISLIAGGVMIRDDIETVRALEPVLMMGDGLGIPRNLDAPA